MILSRICAATALACANGQYVAPQVVQTVDQIPEDEQFMRANVMPVELAEKKDDKKDKEVVLAEGDEPDADAAVSAEDVDAAAAGVDDANADADAGSDDDSAGGDTSPIRWIWWLVIVYMFYCQATICDEYFVESIKVIVEKYGIPEDVAGATLMALGCNGPEMFTNFISIFITHSDIGVGTIVGSEIFNLLCIVGGSIVACPKLPLEVEKAPFVRDCFFYGLSIILLAWVLQDSQVDSHEARILVGCCVLYAAAVAGTGPVFAWLNKSGTVAVKAGSKQRRGSLMSKRSSLVMPKETLQASLSPDEAMVKLVRQNRMMATRDVNEVCTFNITPTGVELCSETIDNSAGADWRDPLISDGGKKMILFKKVVYFMDGGTKDASVVDLVDELGGKLTVEFTFANDVLRNKIMNAFHKNCSNVEVGEKTDGTNIAAKELSAEISVETNPIKKVLLICTYPLEWALGATMGWCDVKIPHHKEKFVACFCMSMVWLAIFSYIMCEVADIIHADSGIPTSILGITVCAVGTSFPNFYASILMALENRSAMAIANALGSNVQNVLLALALPWLCKTSISGPYAVASNGIGVGVCWMGATLVLVFAFAVFNGFKFTKSMGIILICSYFVYLFQALFL